MVNFHTSVKQGAGFQLERVCAYTLISESKVPLAVVAPKPIRYTENLYEIIREKFNMNWP